MFLMCCLFISPSCSLLERSKSEQRANGYWRQMLLFAEAEYLSSLVAIGYFATQQFGHAHHFVNQFAVALGKDAALEVEVVLKTNAHIATHDDGGSGQLECIAANAGAHRCAGAESGPKGEPLPGNRLFLYA